MQISQTDIAVSSALDKLGRRSFMTIIAAGALSAQSTTQQQQPKEGAIRSAGFFAVEAGSSRPGKSIPVSGRRILVKVSGTDTGGGFALFEVPAAPDAGPGLHMHHVENEFFYVLEGELDVQVGTEIVRLGPGGSAYAPRLIPHTWQSVGGKDVRFLTLAQPAGNLEAFLNDLSGLQERGPLAPAELKALFQRHDMELVGPPLNSRP